MKCVPGKSEILGKRGMCCLVCSNPFILTWSLVSQATHACSFPPAFLPLIPSLFYWNKNSVSNKLFSQPSTFLFCLLQTFLSNGSVDYPICSLSLQLARKIQHYEFNLSASLLSCNFMIQCFSVACVCTCILFCVLYLYYWLTKKFIHSLSWNLFYDLHMVIWKIRRYIVMCEGATCH